jgi:hypothetical protein
MTDSGATTSFNEDITVDASNDVDPNNNNIKNNSERNIFDMYIPPVNEDHITDELKTTKQRKKHDQQKTTTFSVDAIKDGKLKNSQLLPFVAAICILVIFVYVGINVILPVIPATHDDVEYVKLKTKATPVSLTKIVDFTKDQIMGKSSGRLNQWFFDMSQENEDMMADTQLQCATNWLKLTLDCMNKDGCDKGERTYYNLLTVRLFNDSIKHFMNIRKLVPVGSHDSSLITATPIRFMKNDKSRHYFNKVKFEYTLDGNEYAEFETTNKAQAFCIQELYGFLMPEIDKEN